MCQREAVEPAVEFRRLGRTELSRVGEIDRRERIDVLYDQHGTELVARHGNWSASAWDPDGHGEHSVEAQVHTLEHYVDTGGIALGAFAGGRLVGIGVVVPHLRPRIAQLAFLHVSAPSRATGIGSRLSEQLEQIARDRRRLRHGRLGDAIGEHRAVLPRSRLPAHGGTVGRAVRARARGRAHAQGALSAPLPARGRSSSRALPRARTIVACGLGEA